MIFRIFNIVFLYVVELIVIIYINNLDYLVIHSSLLWPLISYTPDFASEA